MQCGKCNAAMEEGFVVDYAAGGNRKVAEWVQGEPKGSFWHGVDLSSASQIPIVTYRCAACGYLEFYARGKELGLILSSNQITWGAREIPVMSFP